MGGAVVAFQIRTAADRCAQASAALAAAARIDRLVKGIGCGDIWDEFLRLGMQLSGRFPVR